MEEIWKDIEGYEGLYQVSNLGRVKSLKRDITNTNYGVAHIKEKILKPRDDGKGYVRVVLYKNNQKKQFKIHRLVAKAFISNPENKATVNHINGNKSHNTVGNLEWCTNKENIYHAFKTGLIQKKNKSIVQMDLNGNVLNEFESLCEASKYMNKNSHHNIMYCCKGKIKTAYGYKWKYKEQLV